MKRSCVEGVVVALLLFPIPWNQGGAQDLVITNARIIDGTGRTIERGSIVVAEGLISSVTEGTASDRGTTTFDAQGMTIMPGLIDTHRHDLLGDLQDFSSLTSDADVETAIERETPRRLRMLLAEGFTTIMMPGMYLSAALEVRRLLEAGELQGPRFLFSGPGFTAPDDFTLQRVVCGENTYCVERVAIGISDPDVARTGVRELANAGIDVIKVFLNPGSDLDDAVFAAMADEATSLGLPTMVHAHRVEYMLNGVRLGANRLVHTPGDTSITDGPGARLLRERGVAIATTISFFSPQFAEATGFDYRGAAYEQQLLDNIKHLFDEGVTVAFGTDSPLGLRPIVEIQELRKVLEPEEIIAALTRNAAAFLELSDEIGTLESGMVADLIMIDGDPLADISDLTRVQVVMQSGRVVIDNR